MTHVAAVLPDHSDQHLAQRHRPATAAMLIQGIVAGDVETGRLGHEPGREVHFRTPCVPRFRHHLRVGSSTVKITVTVGVRAKQRGHVLPRQHLPERPALHLGQVPHQPKERHRRRLDGTPRHGLGVKP